MHVSLLFEQQFESSVNSEGIETFDFTLKKCLVFESSVNSEGIETNIVRLSRYE